MRALLFATILLIGCHSGTAPLSGDVYVLETVAGALLPTRYSDSTTNRIHVDSMAFRADGTGEMRSVWDSYQGTLKAERATFTFVRTVDHVEIAFACPAGGCVAPPHLTGTFSSTGLTITQSKVSRLPLGFRRLFALD
jgi:hypothetical protein